MNFILEFTDPAKESLQELKKDKGQQKYYKAVKAALKKLQQNPRHPSLQTHQYHTLCGPNGEKMFEAYAQQHSPSTYRIFFYYGPQKGVITIFEIIPHP